MRKTLRNIVGGVIMTAAGLLIPSGCFDESDKLAQKTAQQATGQNNAYDEAARIGNNPSSVVTGNAVKDVPSTQLAPKTDKAVIESNQESKNLEETIKYESEKRKIVFVKEIRMGDKGFVYDDIFVMNEEGTELNQLTNNGEIVDNNPSWSPDGRKIAFNSYPSGSNKIVICNPDGSEKKEFSGNNYSWSSDGQKISISRSGKITIYDLESKIKRVMEIPTKYINPIWTEDKFIFGIVTSRFSMNLYSDIFSMNLDGSNLVNLTNSPGIDDVIHKWFPQERKIVFSSTTYQDTIEGTKGLKKYYTMNLDGSEKKEVGIESLNKRQISPDGKKEIFTEGSSMSPFVYISDIDGTNKKELTSGTHPSWQPEIKIPILRNTKEDYQLSKIAITPEIIPQPEIFTPNGRKQPEELPYVYEYNVGKEGSLEIFINDGEIKRLTYNPAVDIFASISPDKKRIVFTSNRGGKFAVYVMDINGENVRKVKDLGVDEDFNKTYQWGDNQNIILEKSQKGYTESHPGRNYNFEDISLFCLNIDTGKKDLIFRTFFGDDELVFEKYKNKSWIDPEYKKFSDHGITTENMFLKLLNDYNIK
jgi:TolB protein